MRTSTIDEISRYTNIDKDTLIIKGIQSFLREKKRGIMLERLGFLSRYRVASKGELEDKIKKGEIGEHPAWEDLILLENLEAELERIDGYLENL
jgi:hypothetical protein